jgi:hypothetical protein
MKFCVIVIYSFVVPAMTMTVTVSPSSKASKTNCKSSKSKSDKYDSNKGCAESILLFQHAVHETVGENVLESASIEGVPNLFQPDLDGGTAALTIGMMSMSMPDLGGGTAALTIGEMSMSLPYVEVQKVVPNNDFEPLMMSMSMPSLEELTRVRINSDTDTMTEDEEDEEKDEENREGFIENIKNATDAGIEFLQNATDKVVNIVNGGDGTETDNEEGVEDDTASAGAVAADHLVSFILCQITAAVASLIVMVIVV